MAEDAKDIQEAEVVEQPTAVAPIESRPQSVMVTPAQLRKQTERDQEVRKVITTYIEKNMQGGKDYGAITGKSKSGQEFQGKPTLLKPGAEKFCSLFKIRPTFRKDSETVEMLGNKPGIIAYVCDLVDGRGVVVGEGRGAYKVDPEIDGDYDINKGVKIAEKRAQIDAVLRTGALSDFFTQDQEDAPKVSANAQGGNGDTPRPASTAQVELVEKLSLERFDNEVEFAEFATKQVGASDPKKLSLKQASELISALFKMPKLESND